MKIFRSFARAFPLAAVLALMTSAASAQDALPKVSFMTSMGEIVVELDREHAPATVGSFLRYVMERHFDNTIVYRVVPRFVIQAGSVGSDGNGRPGHEPIPPEANNGLSNTPGTSTKARANDPNSATAEFFLNLVDNKGLDHAADEMEKKTGYTVFGHVIAGMDVVEPIAAVPLSRRDCATHDTPLLQQARYR